MRPKFLLSILAALALLLALAFFLQPTGDAPLVHQNGAEGTSEALDGGPPALLEESPGGEKRQALDAPLEGADHEHSGEEIDNSGPPNPNGLTLRVESAEGLPVPDAEVELYWRAGWGEYFTENGVTDDRGELATPLASAFQEEDVTVTLAGSSTRFRSVGGDAVTDAARTRLLRYRLPSEREVIVRVRDDAGGVVEGAEVTIDELRTLGLDASVLRLRRVRDDQKLVTDASGEARAVLDDVAYEFEARSEALGARLSQEVILRDRDERPAVVELRLSPRPAARAKPNVQVEPPEPRWIFVDVKDTYSGEPIEGARLSVVRSVPKRGSGGEPRTSGLGLGQVKDKSSEKTRYLFAKKRGYSWAAARIPEGTEDVRLTLSMEAELRIEGRAVTEAGAPVPGWATLLAPRERLVGLGGGYQEKSSDYIGTGPPGKFHFNDVSSHTHRIFFRPDDSALPAVFAEARGGDTGVVLVIGEMSEDFASVRGTVRNASTGEPVSGIKVICANSTSITGMNALTDSEGRYLIRGLEPGTYTLTVRHIPEQGGSDFYALSSQEVELAPGHLDVDVEVGLARRVPLLLRAGTPPRPMRGASVLAFDAEGAEIALQDENGYVQDYALDATWEGRVNLFGVPAGRGELRIWAEGTKVVREEPTYRRWIDVPVAAQGLITLDL